MNTLDIASLTIVALMLLWVGVDHLVKCKPQNYQPSEEK